MLPELATTQGGAIGENLREREAGSDTGMLAMFARWCELRRAQDRHADASDEIFGPIYDAQRTLFGEIQARPAEDAADLAVKFYLALHDQETWYRCHGDAAGLTLNALDEHSLPAVLYRDLARFIPGIPALDEHARPRSGKPSEPPEMIPETLLSELSDQERRALSLARKMPGFLSWHEPADDPVLTGRERITMAGVRRMRAARPVAA